MDKIILGIDETNKCPVISHILICAVGIKNHKDLHGLGIKDSKELTAEKRLEICNKIMEKAEIVRFTRLEPYEIDEENGLNLNDKEALKILNLVGQISEDYEIEKTYLDLFDHDKEHLFGRMQSLYLNNFTSVCWSDYKWIAQHDADKRYKVVGAASILSKIQMDLVMKHLDIKYNTGSGNPGDSKTLEHIKKHINHNYGDCQGCKIVRWSWETAKRIKNGC